MTLPDDAASGSEDPNNQANSAESGAKAQSGESPAAEAEAEAPAETPEDAKTGPPEADPDTCQALALCAFHFEQAAMDGEWDDTDYRYYLEPVGVLQAELVCEREHPDGPERAGLFMTRAGWQARKVFLSDGTNPDSYELSFPKEFGYVKPLSHYQPASREHARYPWTKKY